MEPTEKSMDGYRFEHIGAYEEADKKKKDELNALTGNDFRADHDTILERDYFIDVLYDAENNFVAAMQTQYDFFWNGSNQDRHIINYISGIKGSKAPLYSKKYFDLLIEEYRTLQYKPLQYSDNYPTYFE